MEFFINRKSGWADEYVLRMRVTCENHGTVKEISPSAELNNDNLTPLFKDQRKHFVSPELIYLPDTAVYSVRLDDSNLSDSVQMLKLMYRLEKDGPWHGFANNRIHYELSCLTSGSLDVALCPVQAQAGNRIVAMDIEFDSRSQKISPKNLTQPLNFSE